LQGKDAGILALYIISMLFLYFVVKNGKNLRFPRVSCTFSFPPNHWYEIHLCHSTEADISRSLPTRPRVPAGDGFSSSMALKGLGGRLRSQENQESLGFPLILYSCLYQIWRLELLYKLQF
jgi:hypothetical protein